MTAATLTPLPDEAETRLSTPTPGPSPVDIAGPLSPGEPFGNRYRILRVLGAGGMGVVYHAWDDAVGVAVALKVIRPEVLSDPATAREVERRFKRELRLGREVTHRNVVRIHDLGEVDGIKYLTMPFAEGQDLAHILREAGRLPVPRALAIAREIAAGLAAAHDAGVVHRDLKPENIMVDGDHYAQIMDFGISRSFRAATVEGGSSPVGPADGRGFDQTGVMAAMTMAGAVIGTVQYMAPEQAKAEEVDHRADIYALGLIFRDMLVGTRQHAGRSALDELNARMQEAPAGPRSIDEHVSEAIDRIIRRCIEPDPAARYQSTQELVGDLDRLDADGNLLPEPKRITRRLVFGSSAAMIALLLGTWWLAYTPPPAPEPDPVSVLIADFENRAADPVFEGSLEQALGIALEQASYISVFPRKQARSLAVELSPSRDGRITQAVGQLIARREGLSVLVRGSVERAEGGFRLEVEATDAASGNSIARSEEAVGDKDDVLPAASALARRIRAALGESRTQMERLAAAETFTAGSLEAMRAYARGQELLNAGNYESALAAFQQAVGHDPEFGRAYAIMGVIYTNVKQLDKAEQYFQEAIKRLDRMTEREKYRTLAVYYVGVVGNYDKAIENYEALIKAYPADDVAYGNLAVAYLRTMDIQRAKEIARKGLEIHPRNVLQRTNYAAYAMYAGEFETAIAEAEQVIQGNPAYEFAYLPLALSSLAHGDVEKARAGYARLEAISATGESLANSGRADLEMYLGRYGEAIKLLRQGITADQKADNPGEMARKYVSLAEAYQELGRRPEAAAAANRAAALSGREDVLYPAARVLLHAGKRPQASKIALSLENKLQSQTASYARLIAGEIALVENRLLDAIEALKDGQKRHDSWFARYLLGQAYWKAGHVTEAAEEWERCLKRRGETADVFFSDSPTLHYLPPLYYWAGRSRERLGATASARANFERYIKVRAGAQPLDTLLPDVRQRLATLR